MLLLFLLPMITNKQDSGFKLFTGKLCTIIFTLIMLCFLKATSPCVCACTRVPSGSCVSLKRPKNKKNLSDWIKSNWFILWFRYCFIFYGFEDPRAHTHARKMIIRFIILLIKLKQISAFCWNKIDDTNLFFYFSIFRTFFRTFGRKLKLKWSSSLF